MQAGSKRLLDGSFIFNLKEIPSFGLMLSINKFGIIPSAGSTSISFALFLNSMTIRVDFLFRRLPVRI